MCYMCEKCYNPIAVQPYIANCISRLPRLTLLDLQIELMNMLSEQSLFVCIGLTVFISFLALGKI